MGSPLCVMAQNETANEPSTKLLLGIGTNDVLDTYLSPYSYKGTRGDITVEKQYDHTMHRTNVFFGVEQNPAKNVDEYDFGLSYALAHHFSLLKTDEWTIKAGPMGLARLGCIYNERNGNNPAQAKASLMAHLSAAATYTFYIREMPYAMELSFDVPVLGIAYSPQFGQSYYEEFSRGHYDHNCVLAHTFNTPSLTCRALFDIPIGRKHCYLGYNGYFYQTKYNNLRYHAYTHSVVIGIKL